MGTCNRTVYSAHRDLPVAIITRDLARTFREALQDVPWPRPGEVAKMTLPELVEWRRTHPDAPRLSSRSVNKQLGGVQAIVNWAERMILEPLWIDPFSNMRVDEHDSEGGPFEPDELRALFASPIFTAGERPEAGQGDVALWLPLLGSTPMSGAPKKAQLQMIVGLLTRRSRADAADRWLGWWLISEVVCPSARTSRFVGGHR